MSECIFCQIVAKKIPAAIVHEDEHVLVLKDINPQAPVHLLLLPKRHVASILDLSKEDHKLLGHLIAVIQELAASNNLGENGFRAVINTGEDGGQTVPHLHIHLLGGRFLQWPPG